MDSFVNRKVHVGQLLSPFRGEELGYGLYIYHQQIHASVLGVVKKSNKTFYVENNFPIKCVGIQINDVVYAQITKIRQQEAFVSIVQINSFSINKPIQGCIRKEHVRQKLVDQVVMTQSYKPGDFVKAKVISLGDSLRNLYLTTAGQDLGVLVAKNQSSQKLMLPYDWENMIDPNTNQIQKRKVAKPQFK